MPAALPADHDDDAGSFARGLAVGPATWGRVGTAPADGHRDRRWTAAVAVYHPLYHSSHLLVHGSIGQMGAPHLGQFGARCCALGPRDGNRTGWVVNISEPFIRRPAGTSLLALGLFLTGLLAYHFLPVAPVPRVDYPMITVSAGLPGADPATVASTVAAPLERRLGQISGVSEITSVSTLGGTAITIQFNLSRNVDGAARDVQAAINAAAGDLPFNLPAPPTYRKVNPADAPIMILGMT